MARTQVQTQTRVARKQAGLVQRVVVGPKPMHVFNPITGQHYLAKVGETVSITPHAAKAFARYLVDPKVAEARTAIAEAEARAAEAEAEEDDSDES